MTPTEIIEKYEIPREYHEAIFLAFEKGAEQMMRQSASEIIRKQAQEYGRRSGAKLTPEERSERARKAARKRWGYVG